MATEIFDVTRKFVRIIGSLPNGLVEFEFAVGDPDVSVELVMPRAAFDAFCRSHQVAFIAGAEPAAPAGADADFHWSLHQATHQRFR